MYVYVCVCMYVSIYLSSSFSGEGCRSQRCDGPVAADSVLWHDQRCGCEEQNRHHALPATRATLHPGFKIGSWCMRIYVHNKSEWSVCMYVCMYVCVCTYFWNIRRSMLNRISVWSWRTTFEALLRASYRKRSEDVYPNLPWACGTWKQKVLVSGGRSLQFIVNNFFLGMNVGTIL